ncbi:MAG: aminotransferase class V-fold PLP-dependent enzyme [Pseudomonadota bacterium]
MKGNRAYLDHNATTPLRVEARAAMLAALDVVGNPSSVHAEGRAAKGVVETARAQVAALVGCTRQQVIFTSSATEAAALAVAQKARHGGVFAALPTEHDCLRVWGQGATPSAYDRGGRYDPDAVQGAEFLSISGANSETGIMLPGGVIAARAAGGGAVVADITQMAGKVPLRFESDLRPAYAILSAHKLGGPKGVGALINYTGDDPAPLLRGGGQEMNRRSGTENIVGIAGFGAAAEAAARDLAAGAWDRIAELRNILEAALEAAAPETIFVGKGVARLPNTSCVIAPGWKGETQVMQLDLAGFAVSAGSACSSGKVQASRVLRAMGFDENEASCAMRVSLGLETTREEVLAFAETWTEKRAKHAARAA